MATQPIELRDRSRLFTRLGLAAAHDARRTKVELQQSFPRGEQGWIEFDRTFKLRLDPLRHEWLANHADLLGDAAERAAKPHVRFGTLRIQLHRPFERLHRLVCLAGIGLRATGA